MEIKRRINGKTGKYPVYTKEEAIKIIQDAKLAQQDVPDLDDMIYFSESIEEEFDINFKGGAHIFLKRVPDPERFGIAEVTFNEVTNITEKPKNPKSDLCVTGLYIYDKQVWNIIKGLTPSMRGELEITDVNNAYVKKNQMTYTLVDGVWCDAGTPSSLALATKLIMEKKYG